MMFNLRFQKTLAILIFASGIVFLPPLSIAKRSFVALSKIDNNTIVPRIIYIKNPRFPPVMPNEIRKIVLTAAGLAEKNFCIRAEMPSETSICEIYDVFADLVGKEPTVLKKIW